MGFNTPDVEPSMPVPPQPQPIVRIERRDDKEDGLHPLLRTPKMFTDPEEQKLSSAAARSPHLPGSVFSQSPGSKDLLGGPRSDQSPLAPVTDLYWNARESNYRSKESPKVDRNDSRTRSPFAAQDDSDSKFDNAKPASLRDLFTARAKEKPTVLQLERQAAFQQLLNPNAEAGGKAPNSLQPVVSAADVKPGGLGIPTIGGSSALNPRSSDPMAALNRQHERLRGPVAENINKKPAAQPVPVGASLDPRLPLPLNRQPAMHEFPTRKF